MILVEQKMKFRKRDAGQSPGFHGKDFSRPVED